MRNNLHIKPVMIGGRKMHIGKLYWEIYRTAGRLVSTSDFEEEEELDQPGRRKVSWKLRVI